MSSRCRPQQVEQRIAHALLRLVKQSGRKVEHGIEIDFPISRQDIAQMTGTTLHTVSRTLSAWETKGLVESSRQKIIVREPHQLFVLAEDEAGTRIILVQAVTASADRRSAARNSSRSTPCSLQASPTE